MLKTYLEVSFQEKDSAKETARNAGTMIKWDGSKKKWYWEGTGPFPSSLEQYLYQTTKSAYAKRTASFNKFKNSERGKAYMANKMEIAAHDHGFDSAADLEAEHARNVAEMEKEIDDTVFYPVCADCGCENKNGEKKCKECGSKNIY